MSMHATCPPTRPAAAPSRGAPPGREAPEPPEGFAALLDSHSARTAPAEGHKQHQSPGQPAAPATEVASPADAAAAVASPVAAVVTDPALPTLVPAAPAPAVGEVLVPEAAAPAMPLAFAMALTAPAVTAPVTTPEGGAVVPATPVAAPAVPGEELATAPVPGGETGEPVTEEPAPTGAQPAEGRGERGKSADSNGSAPGNGNGNGNAYGHAKEQQGEAKLPDGTSVRPVRNGEVATPAVPAGKPDGALATGPATPAVPAGKPDAVVAADAKTAPATPAVAVQPATPAAPATPAQVAQAAVPLHRAAQTVGQLLQVATDRGITHARLALKPAELGGVEIRLQTSSAGVTAQVIADSPAATRLLLQAGADLRRSLEDAGVNLLSLDVSTQGEDSSAAATAGFAAHAEAREREAQGVDGRGSRGRRTVEAETPDPIRARTLELPGGVLVDVFA